jgi:ferric-dicitrate binding protein FerR (iron transport regulator)
MPEPPVGRGRDRPVQPPRPRWVKVLAVVAVLVTVVVIVLLLTGGKHGPGRHVSSESTAPSVPLARGGGHVQLG